eukprot:6907530-Prorocentrum_lima.AAC.1
MTSSLVGSEMCIRDRPISHQVFISGVRARPNAHRRIGKRIRLRTHPADAVSYTHLTLPTICSV